MSALSVIAEHACFDGVQGYYSHPSAAIGLPMRFAVFQPPQARRGPVPLSVYLAGLTSTGRTLAIKAGAQRVATQLGLMLVSLRYQFAPRRHATPGLVRCRQHGCDRSYPSLRG